MPRLHDKIIIDYSSTKPPSPFGFHTFSVIIFIPDYYAYKLINDFKSFRNKDGTESKEIAIITNNKNKHQNEYDVVYYGRKGLVWRIRPVHRRGDSYINYADLFSVEAIITAKIFMGIEDYIKSATLTDIEGFDAKFNYEAARISPILGTFSDYEINRCDYCINFDLKKLNTPLTSKEQMKIFHRADIPHHYKLNGEYSATSHRFVPYKDSYYLSSKSVNINAYDKYEQLVTQDPSNPNLDDALHIIRFEVQCMARKIYPMKRRLREAGGTTIDILKKILSEENCREVICGYYNRVIMHGDYYTLDLARQSVKRKGYSKSKEDRLILALELVNHYRGIAKAKATLNGKDLDNFRHSLRNLTDIGVNPVTIPRNYNIKVSQGLLDAHINGVRGYGAVNS